MKKYSKVSIIILNWNGIKDTIPCLDSLKRLNYPNYEIIVVDNGSVDNSVEILRKRKDIKLIENKKNLGFAEGSNIGVRNAKGEYVVLLNSDTVVDKNYVTAMVRMIESNDKISIVGSRINNIGEFYNNVETLGNAISLMGEPVNIWQKDETFTFMVSGCSMMFKKSIMPKPFDDDYFAYGEDIYAAWLARLKGYDVRIAPDSKLDHLGAQVRTKASNIPEFHGEKNKIMNPLIFYSFGNVLKMVPIIMINMLSTIIITTFKLRVHIRLKSYIWLLWHWKLVFSKRRFIQSQRKVKDRALAPYITYKIPQNLGILNKLINPLLFVYCFLVRLPVREIYKNG